MNAIAVFLSACACTGMLTLVITIIVWALKNILEWADDIFDAIDDLKYTLNKHKKNREEKN